MSIIDKTYFAFGFCEIPMTEVSNGYSSELNTSEGARINQYIVFFEREYLNKILGVAMTELFYSELAKDPVEEKWQTLKDKLADSTNKISPIANYVYCSYLHEQEKMLMNRATAVVDKVENQSVISNYTKIKQSWDKMVSMNSTFFYWLYTNKDEYETEEVKFDFTKWAELLITQNYGL
jgi:L-rhamnose mutarotase